MTFAPAVAMFVGVAGGFADQGVEAGDLVIPSTVDYYQAGKAAEEFTPRKSPVSLYALPVYRRSPSRPGATVG